ncbi:MAG: hypothetical protein KKE05_07140, partial [Nanoarchaeota archaeon]|nr:hypothetical protein [Nanoarchaeota archaeon]
CQFTLCGDSITQIPNGYGQDEQCDDGNLDNDDLCNNNCELTLCGDAITQIPNGYGFNEQCDDGNLDNNDDCTNLCTNAECGDGIQWFNGAGTEECDDGNQNNDDQCNIGCMLTSCGDAIIQVPNGNGINEVCDRGPLNGQPGYCSTDCTQVDCGSNTLVGNSQCLSTVYPLIGSKTSTGDYSSTKTWDDLRAAASGKVEWPTYLYAYSHKKAVGSTLMRSAAVFNTLDAVTGLPADAVINSVTLRLTVSSADPVVPTDYPEDFATIVSVVLANPPTVDKFDYNDFGSVEYVDNSNRCEISTHPVNSECNFGFNSVGINAINRGGLTTLGVRTVLDVKNALPGYSEVKTNTYFYLDGTDSTNKAALNIVYTPVLSG